MGGSPITCGLPGMQVKPLLPSRRTIVFPVASLSIILADRAMSSGPADIALAILACVASAAAADRLPAATDGSLSRPAAPSSAIPTSTSRVDFGCCGFTGPPAVQVGHYRFL